MLPRKKSDTRFMSIYNGGDLFVRKSKSIDNEEGGTTKLWFTCCTYQQTPMHIPVIIPPPPAIPGGYPCHKRVNTFFFCYLTFWMIMGCRFTMKRK